LLYNRYSESTLTQNDYENAINNRTEELFNTTKNIQNNKNIDDNLIFDDYTETDLSIDSVADINEFISLTAHKSNPPHENFIV